MRLRLSGRNFEAEGRESCWAAPRCIGAAGKAAGRAGTAAMQLAERSVKADLRCLFDPVVQMCWMTGGRTLVRRSWLKTDGDWKFLRLRARNEPRARDFDE